MTDDLPADGSAPRADEGSAPRADEGSAPRADDEPTDREVACFEAGVKFGSLYHQFAGTPLSPGSADALATAMEESIENQPHCEAVTVEMQDDELAAALAEGNADYTEWTGRFSEVRMRIAYEDVIVHTGMAMADGYPLMRIESIEEP